jgi:hypothetical protein
LLWTAIHRNNDTPPFPHASIRKGPKFFPSDRRLGSLGTFPMRLSNAIDTCMDRARFQLSALPVWKPRTARLPPLPPTLTEGVALGDKDGSITIFPLDAIRAMMAKHFDPGGMASVTSFPYLVLPPSTQAASLTTQAFVFQTLLHTHLQDWLARHRRLFETSVMIGNFLYAQPPPRLPHFSILVKTHKSADSDGLYPTRPVVGMSQWTTTGISKILSIAAKILLAADRKLHERHAPLSDTLDLVERLQNNPPPPEVCMATADFSSLYTNILWEDWIFAIRKWIELYQEWDLSAKVEPGERDLLELLFSRAPSGPSETFFQFSTNRPPPGFAPETFIELLAAVVFFNTAFSVPGAGFWQQRKGFPMGTNCALGWANLILRAYEVGHSEWYYLFGRFADDIFLLHWPWQPFEAHCLQFYPPHLKLIWEVRQPQEPLPFMDILFLSVAPLVHSPRWKPTHAGLYPPLNSCLPVHVHRSWIRGEAIRLLRFSTSQRIYEDAFERIAICLRKQSYPKQWFTPPPVTWEERIHHVSRRASRPTTILTRPPPGTVFRIPFSPFTRINWGTILKPIQNCMEDAFSRSDGSLHAFGITPVHTGQVCIGTRLAAATRRALGTPPDPNPSLAEPHRPVAQNALPRAPAGLAAHAPLSSPFIALFGHLQG